MRWFSTSLLILTVGCLYATKTPELQCAAPAPKHTDREVGKFLDHYCLDRTWFNGADLYETTITDSFPSHKPIDQVHYFKENIYKSTRTYNWNTAKFRWYEKKTPGKYE